VDLLGFEPLTSLRGKPSLDLDVTSENALASSINDKKDVKGLTTTGKELIRGIIGRFPKWLPVLFLKLIERIS
jgi:hypothetical protein